MKILEWLEEYLPAEQYALAREYYYSERTSFGPDDVPSCYGPVKEAPEVDAFTRDLLIDPTLFDIEDEAEDLESALEAAFDWQDTREGYYYWESVLLCEL